MPVTRLTTCVCETLCPGGNKVQKTIFIVKIKAKVQRPFTLVSFERAFC